MKAILYDAHGGLDQIRLGTFEDPEPGEGEVVVKVRAVALNGFDPMILEGIPGLRTPMPMIPGGDIAGEVAALGPGVPAGRFPPGARVQVVPYRPPVGMMGETLRGGAAEYVAVPHDDLVPIPDAVSDTDAAVLPIAYGTALRMTTVRGKVAAGETVLVLGATGGVGTGVVQIAKEIGATVIACGSSADKCRKLEAIGADMTIDTSKDDFVKAIHERFGKPKIWGGGGVDVVVNYIGGDTWRKSLKVLTRYGRMLVCGATAGYDPAEDIRYIWSFEQTIVGSNAWEKEDQETLLDMVASGRLKPVVDRIEPLSEEAFKGGMQALMDRTVFGKVIFTLP